MTTRDYETRDYAASDYETRGYQTSRRLRDEASVGAASDSNRLTDLFGDLTRETTLLIRQEVELARAEMNEKVSQVERGITSLSAGAVFLHAALLTLLAAAVFALGLVFALWLSALIVGGVVLLIGGALLAKGRRDVRATNLSPRRTVETVRDMPGRVNPPRSESEQPYVPHHEEVR